MNDISALKRLITAILVLQLLVLFINEEVVALLHPTTQLFLQEVHVPFLHGCPVLSSIVDVKWHVLGQKVPVELLHCALAQRNRRYREHLSLLPIIRILVLNSRTRIIIFLQKLKQRMYFLDALIIVH